MRQVLAAKRNLLREVKRVEANRQEIDRQCEVNRGRAIVEFRCHLTDAAGVARAWAVSRGVEGELRLIAVARFTVAIYATANMSFRRLERLRTDIATDAEQRAEDHPQGDNRDDRESKHERQSISTIWVVYGKV